MAQAFTSPIFWRVVRVPASRRDPPAIAAATSALERLLAIADGRLASSTYLAGERLTLADIQFGHVLYRYHEIDIERAALPNPERYYERLCARPSYRDTVMVSYAELVDSM